MKIYPAVQVSVFFKSGSSMMTHVPARGFDQLKKSNAAIMAETRTMCQELFPDDDILSIKVGIPGMWS